MADKRTATERMSRKARHHREHGKKIYHTTFDAAVKHAAEINEACPEDEPREPYTCQWGDDPVLGETAMVHWHVGRAGKRNT